MPSKVDLLAGTSPRTGSPISRQNAAVIRREHARLFRKDCVGCGSNYSLNLRWRPGSYVEDVLWRVGRRTLALD